MKLPAKFEIFVIVLYCVLIRWTTAKSLVSVENYAIEAENETLNKQNNIDEDLFHREQYAKKMISYMNKSIDPCDDYYEYACGNWKNTYDKRHSEGRRNNLFDIDFKLYDMVENLIKDPIEILKHKYADEIKKARIFYESCLQADLFPLPKSNEYLQIIKNITGFPAIDENWKSDHFDWFNATAHLSNYGVESFVKEDIFPMHPFLPYFKLPDLGFDVNVRSDNIGSNLTVAYKLNEQRMRQYLTTYGVVEPNVSEVIASIFEFWHAILNVTDEFQADQEKCIELESNKHSFTTNKWKKWENYFQIAWNGIFLGSLYNDCPCAYFYAKLDEICNERKEAVANYLAMKFLYRMDARLEDNDGKKDFCNEKLTRSMKFLIDQLYMAQTELLTETLEAALITEEILTVMREKLKSLPWLDEDTRKEALLKELAINLRVGRFESPEIMDQFIKEIRNLQIVENDYEKNNLETAKFEIYMNRYLGLNNENVSVELPPPFIMTGMQKQAMYSRLDNSINIMAGIFNPPAYDKTWPLSLKYGTLGYIIGHEISHAFDASGATFDSTGQYRVWWTKKSFNTFQNLTKCYIDMFNEYEIPEIQLKMDGNKTKNENIADHAGLQYAFHAYQKHLKQIKTASDLTNVSLSKIETMPGFDITPEQLFYLGFTQIWCADYKEKHYWNELDDEHTIDKYRILGALTNSKEFAEAYKCPVGSKMNPTENKCQLW